MMLCDSFSATNHSQFDRYVTFVARIELVSTQVTQSVAQQYLVKKVPGLAQSLVGLRHNIVNHPPSDRVYNTTLDFRFVLSS